MSLEEWLNKGRLTKHQTGKQEIRNLLAVADRDLADCRAKDVSADWRMNIAYNAALQTATAALAACGYRVSRGDSHHYRTIQTLAYTIAADKKLINRFDRFRKKRNIGEYEQAGLVSDQEAKEMIELATQLREQTEWWLHMNYPEFL